MPAEQYFPGKDFQLVIGDSAGERANYSTFSAQQLSVSL